MRARRLVIPGEPVGKGRPRATIRGGHAAVYTPAKTARAEAWIAEHARRQWDGPPWTGPVRVLIHAFFPIRASWSRAKQSAWAGRPHVQAPDQDNIAKAALDSLNGIAFLDDAQVFDGRCVKWWAPLPRLEITLTPFDDEGRAA